MIRWRLGTGAARAVATLILVVTVLLAISTVRAPSPRLDAIAPQVTAPGRVISLQGRFFGADRGTGAVTFSGRAPRTSAYRSWSDKRIEVVVPASFSSGLVRVVTRAGASGGLLLTHRDELPIPADGARLPGAPPIVTSVSPTAGAVGEEITLSGAGFGASPAGGVVRFTAAAGGNASIPALPGAHIDPRLAVESSAVDLDYVRWSDRRIVVRVPAGSRSGVVSVRTATGVSADRDFRVRSEVGSIRYLDPRGFAATYAVTVDGVSADGGVDLYLWIPAIPETPAQLHEVEPAATARPVYRDPAGVELFQLHDLVSGSSHEVRRRYRVRRYAIQADIEPSKVRDYLTDNAFYARFTGGDAVVPSGGRLPGIAERAMRGYVNPLWRARLIFEYVIARLQPAAGGDARLAPAGAEPMDVVLHAIDDRSAAPYEYAVSFSAIARAAGIPARPVAGYLIGDGQRAVPHYWAEFYLEGLGWVPVDPAQDDGAALRPPAAEGAAADSSFGNLDSRRIVLAKGVLDPQRVARGRRVQHAGVTGLQTAHEDVVGALNGYRTRWLELTVTERF